MPNILNTDRGTYDLSNRMDVYRYFCREFGLKGDDMSLCERFFVTEYEAIESKLAKAMEALEFYADPETYIECHNDCYLSVTPPNDEELIRHYQHKKRIGWTGSVKVGGRRARKALKEIGE